MQEYESNIFTFQYRELEENIPCRLKKNLKKNKTKNTPFS